MQLLVKLPGRKDNHCQNLTRRTQSSLRRAVSMAMMDMFSCPKTMSDIDHITMSDLDHITMSDIDHITMSDIDHITMSDIDHITMSDIYHNYV